jgi:uncharacterized membrane protein
MASCRDYVPNSLTMDIFPDGSVNIEYRIEPDPILARINVSLPGKYYSDLIAVDEDGIILDWDPVDGGIEVDSIGAEELSISYSSVSLTNKTGSTWSVSIDSEASTNYLLPLNAVLVGLSSTPSSILIIDNRASITMPPGTSRISYSLGATGTREHSIVLLYQAETKIYEANQFQIETTSHEETLLQATQAYEAGSYIQSERYSQQIIDQVSEIIVHATRANDQIISAQDLLAEKTSSLNSETIDSATAKLDEALTEYNIGQYLSAYTLATETIQILAEAKPEAAQNMLPYSFGFLAIIGISGYVIYSHKNNSKVVREEGPQAQVSSEDIPKVDLDKVFKDKDHLRTDEKAVLRFIEESGGAFITEVRDRFDIPKSSAWRMVKRLKEEGLVTVSMVGRETHLQLRDPGARR